MPAWDEVPRAKLWKPSTMDRPTYSQEWHRVGPLKPQLRPGVAIHRRHFRSRRAYVVHDPASNQFFRLDPVSHHFLSLLDGTRSVDEAWLAVSERYGDHAPTQNEAVGLLGQMYMANLLSLDHAAGAIGGAADGEQLFERLKKRRGDKMRQQASSVLFWRIPMVDPSPAIDYLLPLIGWMMRRWFLVVWLGLVAFGALQVLMKWNEFHLDMASLLKPDTLLLVIAIYLITKIIHEFGHGTVCRHFGGPVHDMGIRMLVFTPVPYCDATSSWGFSSRWQRAAVALAGIIVETTVAAIACIVWARTGDGFVHDVAYNTIWIAGVASLLFNSNPLLRYDGYYVLSDILDIPNLMQRANNQLQYLVQRHAFGLTQVRPVSRSRKEQMWLVSYAIASWTYRLIVFPAILLFVSHQFLGLGMVLAVLAAIAWIVVPVGKFVNYLAADPSLKEHRVRAMLVSGVCVAVVVGFIGLIPVPERTYSEAILENPTEGQRQLNMATEGFIEQVLVKDGQVIEKDQPLFLAINPELTARRQKIAAEVVELEARLAQAAEHDPATQKAVQARLEAVRKQLEQAEEEIRRLSLPAPKSGVVVMPGIDSLTGRFIKRGETLGLIRSTDPLRVTAVIDQSQNAMLFRDQTVRAVEVRVKGQAERVIPARIQRVLPGAQSQLPHLALGNLGGGQLAMDPNDPQGKTASHGFYLVHVALEETAVPLQPGQRAWVRFTLEPSPLAIQWWRKLLRVLDGNWTM